MEWTPERIDALRKKMGLNFRQFGEALGYTRYPAQRAHDLVSGYHTPTQPLSRLLDILEGQVDEK